MSEKKESVEKLRDALHKLKDLDVDELSDAELEEVAGGAEEDCSNWCCSDNSTAPSV